MRNRAIPLAAILTVLLPIGGARAGICAANPFLCCPSPCPVIDSTTFARIAEVAQLNNEKLASIVGIDAEFAAIQDMMKVRDAFAGALSDINTAKTKLVEPISGMLGNAAALEATLVDPVGGSPSLIQQSSYGAWKHFNDSGSAQAAAEAAREQHTKTAVEVYGMSIQSTVSLQDFMDKAKALSEQANQATTVSEALKVNAHARSALSEMMAEWGALQGGRGQMMALESLQMTTSVSQSVPAPDTTPVSTTYASSLTTDASTALRLSYDLNTEVDDLVNLHNARYVTDQINRVIPQLERTIAAHDAAVAEETAKEAMLRAGLTAYKDPEAAWAAIQSDLLRRDQTTWPDSWVKYQAAQNASDYVATVIQEAPDTYGERRYTWPDGTDCDRGGIAGILAGGGHHDEECAYMQPNFSAWTSAAWLEANKSEVWLQPFRLRAEDAIVLLEDTIDTLSARVAIDLRSPAAAQAEQAMLANAGATAASFPDGTPSSLAARLQDSLQVLDAIASDPTAKAHVTTAADTQAVASDVAAALSREQALESLWNASPQ